MFPALTAAIESSPSAGRLGDALRRIAAPIERAPRVRTLLSGTGLGHPLHPLLVTAPVGAWTSASLLDLTGTDARTSRRLVGGGVLFALPTVLSGASDWLDTEGVERRVGSVHAASMILATAAYGASWLVRPTRPRLGVALGLGGAGVASLGGWLGGHLAYGLGVGVDTNAFRTGPDDWYELPTVPQPGRATGADLGGMRVAATVIDGRAAVVADRCSHRGGPLSEGAIEGGCFTCPWHGSRFDAITGVPRRGPASVPQPVYEVADSGGVVRVRRKEGRALRTNVVP